MSREYASIKPEFWTGKTGRQIRALGPEYQTVATYMMSSPHANMIGHYYLSIAYIVADAWGTPETVPAIIDGLVRVGFCKYDYETGFVWVVNMGRHQLGAELKPKDKRVPSVHKVMLRCATSPFQREFLSVYGPGYHFPEGASGFESRPGSPMAASRVEQDKTRQEQEHEQAPSSEGVDAQGSQLRPTAVQAFDRAARGTPKLATHVTADDVAETFSKIRVAQNRGSYPKPPRDLLTLDAIASEVNAEGATKPERLEVLRIAILAYLAEPCSDRTHPVAFLVGRVSAYRALWLEKNGAPVPATDPASLADQAVRAAEEAHDRALKGGAPTDVLLALETRLEAARKALRLARRSA